MYMSNCKACLNKYCGPLAHRLNIDSSVTKTMNKDPNTAVMREEDKKIKLSGFLN
jgi:hypothetical protein